jgi:hypothetical protein
MFKSNFNCNNEYFENIIRNTTSLETNLVTLVVGSAHHVVTITGKVVGWMLRLILVMSM